MLPPVVPAPFAFVFVANMDLKLSPERAAVLQIVDALDLVRHPNITVVVTNRFKYGAQDAVLTLNLAGAARIAIDGLLLREVVSNRNGDSDLGLSLFCKVSAIGDDLSQLTLGVFQFLLCCLGAYGELS